MSSRKRVIYNTKGVAVGPSPANSFHISLNGTGLGVPSGQWDNEISQLYRIQNSSWGFSVTRQDVNQFGNLAAIDRIILESPTVNLDFSYFLTNGYNEKKLGLNIDGTVSAISGLLTNVTDEKNYFIITTPEGQDAINYTDRNTMECFAIGNGFLANYSVEASVGGFPTATVTVEGLNIKADIGGSGKTIPAVNPEDGTVISDKEYVLPLLVNSSGMPSALRPGDISFELETPFGAKMPGEFSSGTAHIQSFNLSAPISREPLQRLGSKFAFSREITFPVAVTMNITANMADLKSGNLADILCNDQDYNLKVTMKEPSCTGNAPIAMVFELRGAKLDSQNFSSSIGSNETVDLVYSAQISGPGDVLKGLFISGSYVDV